MLSLESKIEREVEEVEEVEERSWPTHGPTDDVCLVGHDREREGEKGEGREGGRERKRGSVWSLQVWRKLGTGEKVGGRERCQPYPLSPFLSFPLLPRLPPSLPPSTPSMFPSSPCVPRKEGREGEREGKRGRGKEGGRGCKIEMKMYRRDEIGYGKKTVKKSQNEQKVVEKI